MCGLCERCSLFGDSGELGNNTFSLGAWCQSVSLGFRDIDRPKRFPPRETRGAAVRRDRMYELAVVTRRFHLGRGRRGSVRQLRPDRARRGRSVLHAGIYMRIRRRLEQRVQPASYLRDVRKRDEVGEERAGARRSLSDVAAAVARLPVDVSEWRLRGARRRSDMRIRRRLLRLQCERQRHRLALRRSTRLPATASTRRYAVRVGRPDVQLPRVLRALGRDDHMQGRHLEPRDVVRIVTASDRVGYGVQPIATRLPSGFARTASPPRIARSGAGWNVSTSSILPPS